MPPQAALGAGRYFFLLASAALFALYFLIGDLLFSFGYICYFHRYYTTGKDIFLLIPAICALSVYLCSTGFGSGLARALFRLQNLPRPLFLGSGFVLFASAALAVAFVVFEAIPHVQDGIVQLFQARIFASGSLYLPTPELWEFFDVQYIINDGEKVFGKYQYGQSLFLTLGVLAGAPWLVNPILGGLSLITIYYIAHELFDETTARLTLLLGIASPFGIFMCGSYLSHAASLFLISLCVLCLLKTCSSQNRLYPVLAGLFFGLAFNTKAFSTLTITLPCFLYILYCLLKRTIGLREILLFCLPAAAICSTFFLYNYLLNGACLTTGYDVYDPNWGFGFGPDRGEATYLGDGTRPGHSVANGIKNTIKYFVTLNTDLFGWPSFSLGCIVLLFCCSRRSKWDYLLVLPIIVNTVGYFFLWALAICLGARYYFEAMPMFLILTARGIMAVSERLQRFGARRALPDMRGVIAVSILGLCIAGWVSYGPHCVRTYRRSFWDVNADIHRQVQARGLQNALVFVESTHYRGTHDFPDYYNAGFIYNTLDFNGEVVYARDLGPDKNALLMARHPSRSCYRFIATGRAGGMLKKMASSQD
ncbi:ArnT family glycosyltransferase [Thermodesulfobacteriota bacterium]